MSRIHSTTLLVVVAVLSIVGHRAVVSAADCYPTYVVGGPYSPGDKVSKTTTTDTEELTYNYECTAGDPSVLCNAGVFIPFAWLRQMDQCTGTIEVGEQTIETTGNATDVEPGNATETGNVTATS